MGVARELVDELVDRADRRLLPAVYRSVSISTRQTRSRLRLHARPFVDPELQVHPPLLEVDHTARWVLTSSRTHVSALAGMASLAGLLSVPPEALATVAAYVRLAQRLSVVYGFDPETDRGKMAVWRALAAGLELALPGGGPLDLRASELARAVARSSDRGSVAANLAGQVLSSTALAVGRRASRLVPVVSTGWSARAAGRRADVVGERMMAVLRRLSEARPVDPAAVEDAVELVGPGRA
jgi:hypothetical protein